MQWYFVKTWVGREEELARKICRTIPNHRIQECFVIYQERIWRKQQKSIVHVEPLFPGCVFLTGAIAREQMEETKVMGNHGLHLFPMMQEDARFLEKISGKEHIVKLSYVQKDEKGNICRLSEPLNGCREEIERMQYKKRYAMVRHRLWGEEKILVLGILLKEDMNSQLLDERGRTVLFVDSAVSTVREVLTEEMA